MKWLNLVWPAITSIEVANAATVSYDFTVSWVRANPDGRLARPVIGINGAWPPPHIEANVGDNIVVTLRNELGNQSTSLHFHGIWQNGTTHYDGPVGVSQCGIIPGATFVYNFTVNQPGTFWYHSHDAGQYPDGLRAPLIIHDPNSPYRDQYDEEIVMTVSDWYHDEIATLMPRFLSRANPTGAEPVPDSALINDTRNVSTRVLPGKTYMVRIINVGAFAGQYLWFQDHIMHIIEVDGVYTQPAEAKMIYLTSAQRYSVLISTKNDTTANFPFVASMDQDLFDKVPPALNPNATGWLVYDDKAEKAEAAPVDTFEPFDDFLLVPHDTEPLFDKVDYSFNLDVSMGNLGDGINYAFFNNVTYVPPKVPTLYSVLSTDVAANNASIYGVNTLPHVLQKNQVVEIVLNNLDPGKHPFHLHGHVFQTVARSPEQAGPYVNNETFPNSPMRRDTVMVRPYGNIVLRFRADNPGVWLFHCHIEWHVAAGLTATLIEAPQELQQTLQIPQSHFDLCKQQKIATFGNAAGNTKDFYDLTGADTSPQPLPEGFTSRGIVALAFSCLCAFFGIGTIVWYGAGEIGQQEPDDATAKRIDDASS